jgi:hypothetical protein
MERENESDEHENNSQQPTGVPVASQEPNPEPTRGATENQPQKWYVIFKKPILPQVQWTEVFGSLGVVIGGLVCYIYWNQLQVMSSQLAEMQGTTSQTSQLIVNAAHQASGTHDLAVAAGKQADASWALANLTAKQFDASQQLIESQRASIAVAFAYVNNPVMFRDGGLSIVFSIIMKNNGRLAANKVKVRFTPYFSKWGGNIFSEPMERQRDFCSKPNISRDSRANLEGLTNENALTIIPGDAREWQINFGIKPTDSDIIEWPPSETHQPQTKRLYPIVVGCVDYQSGVMTEPHQTGFIFEIKRGDPRMPSFITMGEDVRREDVVIEQYFLGQGKSY